MIALDLVISADPQRPIRSWAGGTCGNVLSILAYLGWDAYPIGRLDYDTAAARVTTDFQRWGVHLDFVHSAPTMSTPIIIQENQLSRAGVPKHKFTWTCRHCGSWLPSFRPITRSTVDATSSTVGETNVFFFDRLSRAALTLAKHASEHGALVVFEPSGRSDPKLFDEAIRIAHIVKYADQRLSDAGGTMSDDTATLLEVQTLGSRGLRFRHKTDGEPSDWVELAAAPAADMVDTCGSGDWCTAGLLSRVAADGRAGFTAQTTETISSALEYGQELAAWNCGYEGARGGMYAEVDAVFAAANLLVHTETQSRPSGAEGCPACAAD